MNFSREHQFFFAVAGLPLLLLTGCVTSPPPEVGSAVPVWSRSESVESTRNPVQVAPPVIEIPVVPEDVFLASAENLESTRNRQLERLLADTGYGLDRDEIGYYMDTQEARLVQLLQGSPILMSRALNNITLVLSGSTGFQSDEQPALAEWEPVASVLNEYGSTRISIHGSIGSDGNQDENQRASEQEALDVARFLVDSGVAKGRVLVSADTEATSIIPSEGQDNAPHSYIELVIEPVFR